MADSDFVEDDFQPDVRKNSQAAAESMRGSAKVKRDEEKTIDDLSSGPITTPLVPGIGLAGKPYANTGNIAAGRPMNTMDLLSLEASNAEMAKFNSGMREAMGGAGLGGVVSFAPKVAAAAKPFQLTAQSSPATMSTADLIKTAVTHSAKSLADKVIGATGSAAGAELAKRGGQAAVSGIKAATPAAAAASPLIASPISNAVERLRASTAGNPRAAELMSKINAQMSLPPPEFPAPVATGTVTQGTLGSGS